VFAHFLIWAILVVGCGAALLFCFILLQRGRTFRIEQQHAQRREQLLPVFTRYINGDASVAELHGAVGRSLRLAEEIILHFLRDLRGTSRTRLIEAASDLGLLKQTLRDLHSWDWTRRDLAAMRLGVYGIPGTVRDLLELLRDPRIEVRYTAARSLGIIGSAEAVEALVTILGYPDILDTPRVLEIVQIMGPQATEPLRRMLATSTNGSTSDVQLLAIDLVGDLRDYSMVPTLHQMLRSTDTEKVLRALKALGRINAPLQVGELMSLARDRVWQVRAQAARAIGQLGLEEGVLLLKDGLSDQAFWVRRNSAEALLSFGRKGHEMLSDAVRSSDMFARDMATYHLERINGDFLGSAEYRQAANGRGMTSGPAVLAGSTAG
jgi:hypothetical protein